MGSNIEIFSNSLGILSNTDTESFFNGVGKDLPAQSKILSVGCLAAQPILALLSSAGHNIYAIDRSQESIDLAQAHVTAHFEKVDLGDYKPQIPFDMVMAILSLHELSRPQIRSLIYKMGDWMKPGGLFLLAASPIDYLAEQSCRDIVHGCVRNYPLHLKGSLVESTLFTRDEWTSMFAKAGMSLENKANLTVPATADHPSEHHYFMRFRKSVKHSILGPYPLVEKYRGPIPLSETAWKPFVDRLVRDEFDFVLQVLKDNHWVLDVGSGYGSEWR